GKRYGQEERPLRPLLLLLRLSRLPEHSKDRRRATDAAQADRSEVPAVQRRRSGRATLAPRHLLFVFPLSEVRFLAQQPPRPAPLPEMRRGVPAGKRDEA